MERLRKKLLRKVRKGLAVIMSGHGGRIRENVLVPVGDMAVGFDFELKSRGRTAMVHVLGNQRLGFADLNPALVARKKLEDRQMFVVGGQRGKDLQVKAFAKDKGITVCSWPEFNRSFRDWLA